MEPVFTIPYSEYVVAQRLAALFPTKDGYSIFVPASRQEKDIDLVLVRRTPTGAHVATIQVKASRTFEPKPPKRSTRRSFIHTVRFSRFDMRHPADLYMFVGIYPPEVARTRKSGRSWWSPVILCFQADEMSEFLKNVKTRRGKPDSMFYFGFDEPDQVFWDRGRPDDEDPDYSRFLLERRVEIIKGVLADCGGPMPGAPLLPPDA